MDDAFKYIKLNGIESEGEYPYNAVVCCFISVSKMKFERELINIKYILFALLLFYKTINKQKNALNVLVGHFDFFNEEIREPVSKS